MIDHSDAVGWPAKATRVTKVPDARLMTRAQLFPIRAALKQLSAETNKRPLWMRALGRRAVLR